LRKLAAKTLLDMLMNEKSNFLERVLMPDFDVHVF